MPRPGVALAALLALGLTGWIGCSREATEGAPATAPVERGRIERIVVATGTIEPEREVEVRPRTAGIVEKIHVEANDTVEPGQVLIDLERDLLEAQVREARAALDAARVELRYAGIEERRVEQLRSRNAASASAGDEASARSEKAQAQLAQAEAKLASLDVQLGYTAVRAPLAGRVLDVFVEEGNAVSPVTAVTGGTLLLSIAGESSVHLKGLVDENEVARVRPGQPARLRTEAFSGRIFEGAVRKVAPLGQRVQNVTYFEVEIGVTDADAAQLRPRMSGDADIVTEVVDDVLIVPETALRYRGDETFVRIATGEDEAPRDVVVQIGIVDGSRVQVLGDVEAGQEVVLQ